jgi:hypothetical protein
MIYHNGWWHGNRAAFIRLIKENATIIVISNKDNRAVYHAKVLCNLFNDYASGDEEEENESTKTGESQPAANQGSVTAPAPALSKKNAKLQTIFKDKNKVHNH